MQQITILLDKLRQNGLKLATAESCTGGMVAANITSIAGSSDVFERGFITYSNESKTEILGVPARLIEQFGAVSAQVAESMALGAIKNSKALVAVSITGIAGPTGGTDAKPVGLVYIGIATPKQVRVTKYHFSGNRADIRNQAAEKAIELVLQQLPSKLFV